MEKEYNNSKTAEPFNAKHLTTCQDSTHLPLALAHIMNENEEGSLKINTKL
jgi:hypothetical protein